MKNVLSTTFEGHLNHEANNKKRKYFSWG
jgi:hypothetical protein